jgi:hypothetical protein
MQYFEAYLVSVFWTPTAHGSVIEKFINFLKVEIIKDGNHMFLLPIRQIVLKFELIFFFEVWVIQICFLNF